MFRVPRTITALLSVVLLATVAYLAHAGGGSDAAKDPGRACARRCRDCGGAADGGKVCRLVTKPKKVKVTCWQAECEDFCVPCPSKKDCRYSRCVDCNGKTDKACGEDGACAACCDKKIAGFGWTPGGSYVGSKKKLMKKELEVEVCGVNDFKWELVDLCKGCKGKAEENAPVVPPDVKLPAPPKNTEAHIIGPKAVVKMATHVE